jgi:GNAT superfamily N-acetyltransferase
MTDGSVPEQPGPPAVNAVTVRPVTEVDAGVVRDMAVAAWGLTVVATPDGLVDLTTLPALLAERDGRPIGLLAYRIADDALEVVSISATERTSGAGTVLLEEAARVGIAHGCRRLWLATTNDNIDALRFYQRRGLRIVAVVPGAVDEWRKRKPEIPAVGTYGIPMRDALVLQMPL